MENVFYTWIALGVLCIIIETFTATTYSFAVGVAAFIVAIYVQAFHQPTFMLAQFILFLGACGVSAYAFPLVFRKYFGGDGQTFSTSLDEMIGKNAQLKQVGESWKVEINGVDYLVNNAQEIKKEAGMKVKIMSHSSGALNVENID